MITLEIAPNPNCEPVDLRVFHDLEPPRQVHRVCVERLPGQPEWFEVTGWTTAGSPCPAFAQRVDDLAGRLRGAWRERGNERRRELEAVVRRLMRRHPEAGLARQRGRLETARRILAPAMRTGLGVRRQTLRRLSERLAALSPLGVLSRGYSLTFALPEMAVVRSAAALSPGDRIRVRLGEGSVDATVDRKVDG